jgi:hypothetical protein
MTISSSPHLWAITPVVWNKCRECEIHSLEKIIHAVKEIFCNLGSMFLNGMKQIGNWVLLLNAPIERPAIDLPEPRAPDLSVAESLTEVSPMGLPRPEAIARLAESDALPGDRMPVDRAEEDHALNHPAVDSHSDSHVIMHTTRKAASAGRFVLWHLTPLALGAAAAYLTYQRISQS